MAFPLPLIDDFLLDYNVGHALLVVFGLSVLGSVVVKSRKVLALNLVLFGVVFAATPSSLAPFEFRMFGIALLVAGPVLFATTRG